MKKLLRQDDNDNIKGTQAWEFLGSDIEICSFSQLVMHKC